MFRRVVAIEVDPSALTESIEAKVVGGGEDDEPTVRLQMPTTVRLPVVGVVTADMHGPDTQFWGEIISRPGGMLVFNDVNPAAIQTADESISDAAARQQREYDRLREQGLSQARGGGEGRILPDEARESLATTPAPAKRPARGAKPA